MNIKNTTIQSVLKNIFAVSRLQFFNMCFLLTACCLLPTLSFSQCLPLIAIDGNNIVADENNVKGMKMPAWLTAGQSLAKGQFVYSISVIEFTVNGTSLDYSQNKKVTTIETVPAGKVWKIESVLKDMALPSSSSGVYIYAAPGVYTFTSQACITVARVQVWGAGGGGGGGNSCSGTGTGGGGAGGYSEGTYQLATSTNYTITVGAGPAAKGNSGGNGAAGGTSSVDIIGISATGGAGGFGVWCGGGGQAGGAGGTGSGGQINFTGQAGAAAAGNGGTGGNAPNGGGAGGIAGTSGANPGGGGGGGNTGSWVSGAGADGKVVITLGSGEAKVPCVTLYQYGATNCTTVAACPTGWTDAGCGQSGAYGADGTKPYCRTCYKCD